MAQSPNKYSGWTINPATIGLGAAASLGASTVSASGHYMSPDKMAAAPISTPGSGYVDQALLTAKLEAVEARTDTKFAQLLGELRLVGDRVSSLSTTLSDEIKEVKKATATVKWNILATGIALGALILGLFAYGATMLDLATALFQAG